MEEFRKPSLLATELSKFIKDNTGRFPNLKYLQAWPQIIGPKISAFTKARKIHQGTLIVDVKEKGWQIELQYFVGDILRKYQEKFPENNPVKKVYFKYQPNLEVLDEKSKQADHQGHSRKVSALDEKIDSETDPHKLALMLKDHWKKLKALRDKIRQSKPTVHQQATTPVSPNSPRSLRKSGHFHAEIDELFSFSKRTSEFTNHKDEFQPFDLY